MYLDRISYPRKIIINCTFNRYCSMEYRFNGLADTRVKRFSDIFIVNIDKRILILILILIMLYFYCTFKRYCSMEYLFNRLADTHVKRILDNILFVNIDKIIPDELNETITKYKKKKNYFIFFLLKIINNYVHVPPHTTLKLVS